MRLELEMEDDGGPFLLYSLLVREGLEVEPKMEHRG